ncbi:hypothetical protein J6590_089379 [Homalodisca vitripennis]|nr:hypothetical protein J6590_089379 [Homalodisca vitripennis]
MSKKQVTYNSSFARPSYRLPSDKKVQSPRDNSGLRETRGRPVVTVPLWLVVPPIILLYVTGMKPNRLYSRDHFWLDHWAQQKLICHLNLGNHVDAQEWHITNRKCRDSGVQGQFDRSSLLREMTVGVGGGTVLDVHVLPNDTALTILKQEFHWVRAPESDSSSDSDNDSDSDSDSDSNMDPDDEEDVNFQLPPKPERFHWLKRIFWWRHLIF